MTTIAHNQNVVKLTQFNKGVSMQMLEPTEISVSLSPRAMRFIRAYKEQYQLDSVSDAIELIVQEMNKEKWRKGYILASQDEEYLREEKILAEAGVSDGIE